MKVLWLAWKDYAHPERGGAELVLRELLRRQVADGNQVTLLTARWPGSKAREVVDGVEVIRVGSNRYIHPIQALWYYLRHLRGKYDVLVETVNTAPYLSLLFRGRALGFAFYHQMAREVWYFETHRPLSYIGFYLIEPVATWLLSRAKTPLITVSESTKQDLARFGWPTSRTHVLTEGIEVLPAKSLASLKKYTKPTMLGLGAMRGMKRTLDQIEAFEYAKLLVPDLCLKLAGDSSSSYGKQVLARIANSPHKDEIEYLGRVSKRQKIELMRRCHIIVATSVKEGWGLIITEAASQGTPAVVYDVDGLRDSVRHQVTGLVTKSEPAALAQAVAEVLTDQSRYHDLQHAAWQWSKQFTFDNSYKHFKKILEATT